MMKESRLSMVEKTLFHGTKSTMIDPICSQNFDFRLNGTNGTAYGNGSYFARDASYSLKYCDPSLTKSMFAAKVLVGKFTLGQNGMKRPPVVLGNVLYDSVVDRIEDPALYVVFDSCQIYPQFIINFRQ